MKTLALDLSTPIGTLSWSEAGRPCFAKEWPSVSRGKGPVFADLLGAVEAGCLDLSQADHFAVGVGPGAFSGLRASVSLIRSLAQPGNTPVTAVSSARALAAAVMAETGASRIVVFGDARRQELWAGSFLSRAGVACLEGDWQVFPSSNFPSRLCAAGALWVTADWESLSPILRAVCPQGVELVTHARLPQAIMVALLADLLRERGMDGEPPVPVYVHPAVSIAPRFQ